MRIRAIDENRDWQWGLGKQSYRVDSEALDEDVTTRVRCWRNDCFYDMGAGVQWDGKKEDIRRDITRQILGAEGVLAITNFNMTENRTDRTLSIDASIDIVNLFLSCIARITNLDSAVGHCDNIIGFMVLKAM